MNFESFFIRHIWTSGLYNAVLSYWKCFDSILQQTRSDSQIQKSKIEFDLGDKFVFMCGIYSVWLLSLHKFLLSLCVSMETEIRMKTVGGKNYFMGKLSQNMKYFDYTLYLSW